MSWTSRCGEAPLGPPSVKGLTSHQHPLVKRWSDHCIIYSTEQKHQHKTKREEGDHKTNPEQTKSRKYLRRLGLTQTLHVFSRLRLKTAFCSFVRDGLFSWIIYVTTLGDLSDDFVTNSALRCSNLRSKHKWVSHNRCSPKVESSQQKDKDSTVTSMYRTLEQKMNDNNKKKEKMTSY